MAGGRRTECAGDAAGERGRVFVGGRRVRHQAAARVAIAEERAHATEAARQSGIRRIPDQIRHQLRFLRDEASVRGGGVRLVPAAAPAQPARSEPRGRPASSPLPRPLQITAQSPLHLPRHGEVAPRMISLPDAQQLLLRLGSPPQALSPLGFAKAFSSQKNGMESIPFFWPA